MYKFRIRDLLHSRTIFEADRGRDIVAYIDEHKVPGDKWEVQYNDPVAGWQKVPAKTRKVWYEKSHPPQMSDGQLAMARCQVAWAERRAPHLLTPWLQ